jgi:hypothetical protein
MPGDVSLKGIEFEIKGKSDSASSSIDKLIGKLDALQKALSATSGIKKLSSGLKSLQEAMSSLSKADVKGASSALKEFGKVAKSLEGLATMSKDLASFARSMVKLGENPEAILNVAEALTTLGSVDLTNLIQAKDSMRAFADAMKAINSGGVAPEEEHISAWKRLGDAIRSISKAGLKGIGSLLVAPFKGAWKDVTKFAAGLTKAVGSFKRIIGYRIVRSIIKEIGQAFSEGIKNLYGWSTLVGGKFAASMNQIATSTTYLKNSLAAAAAPIVNALAPAIDFLIDKIVALINVINQLFAKLAGATSWTKAIKKTQEYDDAIAGAGGAAKEALKYLAPFDELNRLPDDNKGGGGGSADDYSDMFEEQTEFLEGIKDFADSIRAAIQSGDWEGLGVLIGEKINELIDKIDFASLGTKVGEKINALFTTEYWTLKTINFQNIGAKIAEFLTGDDGIGGALQEIDFSNIGGIIAEKLTALPEVLIGVVNKLDFSVVGKSLGDTIRGFLNGITNFIKNVDWGTTLENAIKGMFEFVKGLDIGELAKSLLTLLGSVVGAVADGLGTLLLDLVDVITDPDTWTLVGAWLKDLPAKLKNAGIQAINAFVAPLADGINKWIEKYNGSKISEYLGKIDPLKFDLIPEVPESELTKNYNAAKKELEAKAKAKPIILSTTGKVDKVDKSHIKASQRTIDITGKYAWVDKSKLTGTQKKLDVTGEYKYVNKSRLTTSQKTLVTTALLKKTDSSHLTESQKTIKATLDYKYVNKSNLTSKQKTLDATLDYKYANKSNLTKDQKSVVATLDYKYVDKSGLTSQQKTINATLDYKYVDKSSLKASQKTIDTTSAYKYVDKTNLTAAQKTIGTTSKYTSTNFSALTAADREIDTKAKLKEIVKGSGVVNASGQMTVPVIANIVSSTGLSITPPPVANGGVISNGVLRSIPQYANGGKPHGSLFLAGEAGAELVGHIGGRTEVLNRSQIAATMYAAVRSAISSTTFSVASNNASAANNDDVFTEETLYRAFSRALADSDLGGDVELDGDTLYRAMVTRNRRNTRMTGVNAMA